MLSISEKQLSLALQKATPGLTEEDATNRARDLINDTDTRLEQNVLEWMQGTSISDIWINKYCINAILSIQNSTDFLDALDAMNLYLRDPSLGEYRIWRTKR